MPHRFVSRWLNLGRTCHVGGAYDGARAQQPGAEARRRDTARRQTKTAGTRRIPLRLGPIAAVLLLGSLGAAIGTEGVLPAASTQALLGVLLVLDVIAVEWLTRPRG